MKQLLLPQKGAYAAGANTVEQDFDTKQRILFVPEAKTSSQSIKGSSTSVTKKSKLLGKVWQFGDLLIGTGLIL